MDVAKIESGKSKIENKIHASTTSPSPKGEGLG